MFQRVQTKEEHFMFEQLWGDFCEERSLTFVERNLSPERFLLIGEGEKFIGTVECARYKEPDESNSEFFYPFSKHPVVQELGSKKVYEIGKLSIDSQFRGRGHFKHLTAILFIHALETKADWYIAVLTKRMYLYLRFLGFRAEPIDDEFLLSEKVTGVPVRIEAFAAMKHVYSVKEFRDVLKGNAYAQKLLQQNHKNIMLT
ncbi:hypothetical protein [Ectobacillus panaciterrae]|uniref:hypothetical protein n=1 Tax=Ectobacillus panaciterrae TaxID=363872 RepID=UPI00042A3891|nr:hypothetical protein [Ectobacillus panaciterrae]